LFDAPPQKILHTPLNGAPQKCFQSGPALAKAGPGCIFRRFYELRMEVAQFLRMKGQPMAEMEDES